MAGVVAYRRQKILEDDREGDLTSNIADATAGRDDCRKTYEELSARGVEFIQPPEDRPYGVEALMRDNSGNWCVLVEAKEYTAESVADGMADGMADETGEEMAEETGRRARD